MPRSYFSLCHGRVEALPWPIYDVIALFGSVFAEALCAMRLHAPAPRARACTEEDQPTR